MKKLLTTTLAISATLISGAAIADVNPFGATELSASNYLQLAEAEMKCGANMKMDAPVKTPEKEATEKAEAAKKAEDTKASTEANKKH